MGNSKSKSVQPSAKNRIPQKYKCPIAQSIMLNPIRIVCSGNVYDKLSITKWNESKRTYDPVSGTPFICQNEKLLIRECTHLKQGIQQFLEENKCYQETHTVNENLDWEQLCIECDQKIKETTLKYEQICQSLLTKGHRLLFPNDKKDVRYDQKLLELLSASIIPIITFIGASRHGKSTLLNDILGLHENPAFEMSNSPDIAQTKGAWVALYNPPNLNHHKDTKEEKKENDELIQILYDQSFFLIDMEGLTKQVTKFTEKIFYAVYAFSDVIIWNDKDIGSDYFKNLMTKLKKTMPDISDSSNKPAFLYLRRDKDNFFEFGKHQTFDKYINHNESFKSFRELNLFSVISGYQLAQRPSKKIPFSTEQLMELLNIIFSLNENGNIVNKSRSRFITNYDDLQKQIDYINKYGILSVGMQIIMNHDVLKWFLFEDDDKNFLYAQKHKFSQK
eukprot:127916_1